MTSRFDGSALPARAPAPPWRRPRVLRWTIVIGLLALLEVVTRLEWMDPTTVVPPSDMLSELVKVVPTPAFREDLLLTLTTIGAAFAIGVAGGVPLGVLFWRIPAVGRVLEPFVVTGYAMPTLVFYPVLLAVMGLNSGPIIVIAASMALIPIALTTMAGLAGVKPVLHKLAKATHATSSQYYRKVLLPAATPLVFPGLRLGFIYTIIGTIAMEFMLASKGIGFRAGFHYREFDIAEMYAYILVVIILSVLVNSTLTYLEGRIRRDML